MKKQILLFLLVAGSMFPTYAQTKPELSKLTDAQKAETLAFNSTAVHAGSIAYAKSMGKVRPSHRQTLWSKLETGTGCREGTEERVEHMNAMAQAFGTSFELTNWTAKEAIIKRGMLLQDPKMAGLFTSVGVTAQDMEDWNEGVMSEIATSMGFSMSQRKEGQNVIVTVKAL